MPAEEARPPRADAGIGSGSATAITLKSCPARKLKQRFSSLSANDIILMLQEKIGLPWARSCSPPQSSPTNVSCRRRRALRQGSVQALPDARRHPAKSRPWGRALPGVTRPGVSHATPVVSPAGSLHYPFTPPSLCSGQGSGFGRDDAFGRGVPGGRAVPVGWVLVSWLDRKPGHGQG
jgi:hypothetical protein